MGWLWWGSKHGGLNEYFGNTNGIPDQASPTDIHTHKQELNSSTRSQTSTTSPPCSRRTSSVDSMAATHPSLEMPCQMFLVVELVGPFNILATELSVLLSLLRLDLVPSKHAHPTVDMSRLQCIRGMNLAC